MQKIAYQTFLGLLRSKWKQGQHLLISGPTGSGKSYVAEDIKEIRKYLVVIASKKSDDTLDNYNGFFKTDKWPPPYGVRYVLFWKKPKTIEDLHIIRKAVYDVLSDVFVRGGWSIYFDDIAFLSGTLKLDPQLRMMYTQVRSNNTSLIASVQRPKRIPVEVVSQSSYIILFSTPDENDIETVAHNSGQYTLKLKNQVKQLKTHEFLFIEHGKEPIHVESRIL